MGGQVRTPKLSLEGGGQLRTPKLSLADAGGGAPSSDIVTTFALFLMVRLPLMCNHFERATTQNVLLIGCNPNRKVRLKSVAKTAIR